MIGLLALVDTLPHMSSLPTNTHFVFVLIHSCVQSGSVHQSDAVKKLFHFVFPPFNNNKMVLRMCGERLHRVEPNI